MDCSQIVYFNIKWYKLLANAM